MLIIVKGEPNAGLRISFPRDIEPPDQNPSGKGWDRHALPPGGVPYDYPRLRVWRIDRIADRLHPVASLSGRRVFRPPGQGADRSPGRIGYI